jgi:HD-GYP domain-containing protein (c-di-GMP phosphodiesterase class II)
VEKIKKLCEMVRADHRFLLRALKNTGPEKGRSYLVIHGVKSTIISLIIGNYLKLPFHRLIELGAAALLHEAGMIRISSKIYLKDQALTPEEQQIILSHPVRSYNILKESGFPLEICIAALEHHERENGEGYPRKLTGNRISLYAKIIAAACSYEALTNTRPYKEAKDGHNGMVDLLKNTGKRYDDAVIRALVNTLSLYPIGLYVLLSNGRKGQVVDINPENLRFPRVQIFGDITPGGRLKTTETSPGGLSIVRPLQREEIEECQSS